MKKAFWIKRIFNLSKFLLKREKTPIVAIFVYDNFEVGISHNGFNFLKLLNHAELLAFVQFKFYLKKLNKNLILFISLEPCFLCKSFLFASKTKFIVFGAFNNFYLNNNFKKNIIIEYYKKNIFEYNFIFLLKFFFLKKKLSII